MTDEQVRAWEALRAAAHAEAAREHNFSDVSDHAALIVRAFAATRDRYSPDRQHPVIGGILDRVSERYGELRHHDFEFASRVSMTEAVRGILAMDADAVRLALTTTRAPGSEGGGDA